MELIAQIHMILTCISALWYIAVFVSLEILFLFTLEYESNEIYGLGGMYNEIDLKVALSNNSELFVSSAFYS